MNHVVLIMTGIGYYMVFAGEVDAWIAEAQVASERAEAGWERRQALLS